MMAGVLAGTLGAGGSTGKVFEGQEDEEDAGAAANNNAAAQ